jgi:clan AA aspartic protease
MISGIVKGRHATIAVVFRLPNRPDFSIYFVIDTGFTDHLSLPPEAVSLLGLPFKYAMSANLADNSNVILPIHEAIIIWSRTKSSCTCSGEETFTWDEIARKL